MSQFELSAPPGERTKRTFPRSERPAPLIVEFYRSPIGRKWVMALSGIVGLSYVLVHMIGNLHLYEGPRQINAYGEQLRTLGGHLAPRTFVLWILRFGLIGAFVIHVHAAYSLVMRNRRSRPQNYNKQDFTSASYASRSMALTGTWMLLFIVYHLVDLTGGKALTADEYSRGDVYHNVVESFSNPLVALFYVLSMAVLCTHIWHGAWSMFQSLGVNSPRINASRRVFAYAFAGIIFVGNVSFPVMVTAGVISEDERCWPYETHIEELHHEGASQAQIEILVDERIENGGCPFQDIGPDDSAFEYFTGAALPATTEVNG